MGQASRRRSQEPKTGSRGACRANPLTARTGLRQPPETALGAPEALRSPELVTQAPNTLTLIGYYSFFMKPSRLLPSSLGKTSAAIFCNYTSLVFVRAQERNLCVPGPRCHFSFCLKRRCYARAFLIGKRFPILYRKGKNLHYLTNYFLTCIKNRCHFHGHCGHH